MQAGAGAAAEELHPGPQKVRETWNWLSETSKLTPGNTLLPARPHLLILLILSNSSTPW